VTRTRRRSAAALLVAAAGTQGWAQTAAPAPKPPAARLLAARPAPPSGVIARGTTPEAGTFANPPQAPTLTEQRRTFAGVPAPEQRPQQQPAPPPGGPPYATGQSGVYAGPPAYRWYGYGSTTPGANPYAPSGQYPRGSANWYAQTGATPGAFPVPVSAGGEQLARFDPPAYAGPPPEASAPLPPPRVEPAVPAEPPTRTVVAPHPITVTPPPADGGPIAVGVPTPMPPAEQPPVAAPAPAPIATAGLTWQPQAESADTLRFTAAKAVAPAAPAAPAAPLPAAMPQPIATSEQPPAFKPSAPPAAPTNFQPATPPPAPAPLPQPAAPPTVVPPAAADWKAAPTARGQQPAAEPPSLAAQVRNACYGLARVAEVSHTGPSSLTVKLVAASEADARRAAGEVAKVPALRPYTVKFTAELAGKP
jgi:hypothetical protein